MKGETKHQESVPLAHEKHVHVRFPWTDEFDDDYDYDEDPSFNYV